MWTMSIGAGLGLAVSILTIVSGIVVLILKLKPGSAAGTNQVSFTVDEKKKLLDHCEDMREIIGARDSMDRFKVHTPPELLLGQTQILELIRAINNQLVAMTKSAEQTSVLQNKTAGILQMVSDQIRG